MKYDFHYFGSHDDDDFLICVVKWRISVRKSIELTCAGFTLVFFSSKLQKLIILNGHVNMADTVYCKEKGNKSNLFLRNLMTHKIQCKFYYSTHICCSLRQVWHDNLFWKWLQFQLQSYNWALAYARILNCGFKKHIGMSDYVFSISSRQIAVVVYSQSLFLVCPFLD